MTPSDPVSVRASAPELYDWANSGGPDDSAWEMTRLQARRMFTVIDERMARLEAAAEFVARKMDSLAPGDVRRLLRPFRVRPYTDMGEAQLRAALDASEHS